MEENDIKTLCGIKYKITSTPEYKTRKAEAEKQKEMSQKGKEEIKEIIKKLIKKFFEENSQIQYCGTIITNKKELQDSCTSGSILYNIYKNEEGRAKNYAVYEFFKDKFGLKKRGDIIWLKFTKSGRVGVVGAGYDVSKKETWEYNKTAGKLLKAVNEEWDEDYIIIIPIKGLNEDNERNIIETAFGDYLINNKVPVIDYYSHNIQKTDNRWGFWKTVRNEPQ